MGGFNNPLVGGGGALAYPAIKSPNYAPGSAGWSIKKDGTAEFNQGTFRSSIAIGTSPNPQILADNTLNYAITTKMFSNNGAATDVTSFANIRAAIRFPSNDAHETTPPLIAETLITYTDGSVADALLVLDGFTAGVGHVSNFTMHVSQSSASTKPAGIISGTYQVSGSTITLFPQLRLSTDVSQGAGLFQLYGEGSSTPGTGGGVYLSAQLDATLQPAIENWHAMAANYLNAWSDTGGGNIPGRYRLLACPPNAIEVEGDLSHASFSGTSQFFTLPAGFTPASIQGIALDYYAVTAGFANGANPPRVGVGTDGSLTALGIPAGCTRIRFHGLISAD